MKITWLGHASVLMETDKQRLLFDPVVRRRVAHLRRRSPVDRALLQDVDAVLLSHAHHDHLDLASLRRVRRASDVSAWHAPRGAAQVLERSGFDPVIGRSVGGEVHGPGYTTTAVPAAHGGERLPWVRSRELDVAVGYVVRPADGPSVWFAGDTELDDILEQVGTVDVALVPIGGWWRTLGPGHMNPERAARAVQLVGASVAIPIHWGTYHPIGLYRAMRSIWYEPAREFERVMAQFAPHVEVRVLEPGETTEVQRTPSDRQDVQ